MFSDSHDWGTEKTLDFGKLWLCASRAESTSHFMAKPLGVLIQSTSASGKSTLMDAYYKMWLAHLAPGRLRGVSPRGSKAQEQPMTGQSVLLGRGQF